MCLGFRPSRLLGFTRLPSSGSTVFTGPLGKSLSVAHLAIRMSDELVVWESGFESFAGVEICSIIILRFSVSIGLIMSEFVLIPDLVLSLRVGISPTFESCGGLSQWKRHA